MLILKEFSEQNKIISENFSKKLLLNNTFEIKNANFSYNDKTIFKILSTIEVPGNYIGDGVFLEAKRPIFRLDSDDQLLQVSFNNYDRAAFRLENELTVKFYDAIKKFDLLANNKEYQWRHILKPGELLIFNNWRILHGRSVFKGIRKISGCYINKEDFDSSCRINQIF